MHNETQTFSCWDKKTNKNNLHLSVEGLFKGTILCSLAPPQFLSNIAADYKENSLRHNNAENLYFVVSM